MLRLSVATLALAFVAQASLAGEPGSSRLGVTDRSSTPQAVVSRCGSVSYGGRGYVLYYTGMSCTKARTRVRHVHGYKRLRGWRCSSGTKFRTGGYCKRGRRNFGWHPGD
jgi:hypothetical protein